MPISPFARRLLAEMAKEPRRLSYQTTLLGGVFGEADVARLDAAYKELVDAKLAEPSGVFVSFFGNPKELVQLTPKGLAEVEQGDAA